jgi:hypothetical protein
MAICAAGAKSSPESTHFPRSFLPLISAAFRRKVTLSSVALTPAFHNVAATNSRSGSCASCIGCATFLAATAYTLAHDKQGRGD